ncbi:MAG TPA: MMPL family transporter [Pirellulales bacterium]|jgi:hypothetical protein|nr:MMPL family transporter [Pirellulales bacterium]
MDERQNTFFARYSRWIIALALAVLPLALTGALITMGTNRNDVKEWLPESFTETQEYHRFEREFSSDTFIEASWEGCTLDDPRLGELAARLAPPPGEPVPETAFFTQALTGASLLERLTSPPVSLPRAQAIERLRHALIGPDGQQTCIVLTVSEYGKEHLVPMIAAIEKAAADVGIPRESLHMAGPPVDNATIDQVSESMRQPLMILAGVLGFGLSLWYLRNLRLAIMVFLGGAYSAVLSLALVALFGGTMNSVLFTMPAVAYTGGLSAAIHVVNYYRHDRARHGLVGSPERGLRAAWIPCLLSAGTTSLGLISLCSSAIVPIKTFGFYSALGVMMAVGLIFLYLPAALQLWPPPMHESPKAAQAASALNRRHRLRMRRLAKRIIARPIWIWVVFMTLMVVCGAGLHRMKTTVNLMSLFMPNAPIIDDYRWLEDKIGDMVPLEVVLRLDKNENKMTLVERLELVERIQEAIAKVPHVGSSLSAVTFVPDLNPRRVGGLAGAMMSPSARRLVLDKRLEANRDQLLVGDYLADDPAHHLEMWRISVRVAALAGIDYGQFIHDLREQVEPVVAEERAEGVQGIVDVVYTGVVPVVYKAERELLDGLIDSFFMAFAMIAAMMAAVFRDIRAGLYTMLPNVWPVAVVFGLMSWFGVALDIGTMMTASVAMGVCVDDTVHFANWFRRATREGLDRRTATVVAFENSAGAIYQSTVIVALGLGIFAFSHFMPTRRFGYLMGILLCCGLIADLVLTPAMLAGPIGKYFTHHGGLPQRRYRKNRRARQLERHDGSGEH